MPNKKEPIKLCGNFKRTIHVVAGGGDLARSRKVKAAPASKTKFISFELESGQEQRPMGSRLPTNEHAGPILSSIKVPDAVARPKARRPSRACSRPARPTAARLAIVGRFEERISSSATTYPNPTVSGSGEACLTRYRYAEVSFPRVSARTTPKRIATATNRSSVLPNTHRPQEINQNAGTISKKRSSQSPRPTCPPFPAAANSGGR